MNEEVNVIYDILVNLTVAIKLYSIFMYVSKFVMY